MKELKKILSLPEDATPEDITKAVENLVIERDLLNEQLAKASPKDADTVKQIFIDHPHFKVLYFDKDKINFHTSKRPGFEIIVTREEALTEKKGKK